ncbi:type IV pilus assembly protein PilM [Demequina sediminicola]|uniref:type IV pilus assembly protein PilM n=1 Tax=Demequina sediminicola TaxID=1095026 RepID=UPI0007846C87|nr:type IV pilus assembly protein PilM [Demequina sediminicola]
MATKHVAIDVGETAIRVAQVEMKGGNDPRDGASLTAFAERPVPAGVIRAGEIEEPGAFAAVVKQAVAAAKVSAKSASVSVGHPSVVIREVDVPSQSLDKVRKSLAFHVRDSLPMAVDDALMDFYPTAEFEGEQGKMLKGMLVAAPREVVRGVITALDGSGVHLSRVDHTAFALWRSVCRGELAQGTVAIVDVGAATTTIVVSQQGAPRLVRVLAQGGADATKAIRTSYKGSSVDAEQLKFQIGMNPQAPVDHRQVVDAVSHAMGPLIESIRNTLVYFASSNPGAAAQRLVLTGGGAYLNGFGQAISSATRLPVMIGDPLAGMGQSKKVDVSGFRGREAVLATVVGLAMGVE